jgi:hypothetical protein
MYYYKTYYLNKLILTLKEIEIVQSKLIKNFNLLLNEKYNFSITNLNVDSNLNSIINDIFIEEIQNEPAFPFEKKFNRKQEEIEITFDRIYLIIEKIKLYIETFIEEYELIFVTNSFPIIKKIDRINTVYLFLNTVIDFYIDKYPDLKNYIIEIFSLFLETINLIVHCKNIISILTELNRNMDSFYEKQLDDYLKTNPGIINLF